MFALACDNTISTFSVDSFFVSSQTAYAPRKPADRKFIPVPVNSLSAFSENLTFEMKEVISSLSVLDDNWDGYGALKAKPRTIENAKSAASSLFAELPAADIFLNPNGTITFEWETDKGIANLEIGETRFSFYIETADGELYPISGEASDISWLIPFSISTTLFEEQMPAQTVTNISFFSNDIRTNS